jgi:son of sevenless-like protein
MIVLSETKEIRATLITRFIHIAMACLTLNNFNGILEFVTALTSVACSRLLMTWQLIDPIVMRHFEKLQELVSVANKFKSLREAQEYSEGPCIPYLGVYLGDLTFIEDGNPELTLDGLINFDKYRMVAQIILRGEQFKDQSSCKLYPINIIQNWLENPVVLNEDDSFDESLKREPREEILLLKSKLKKNS